MGSSRITKRCLFFVEMAWAGSVKLPALLISRLWFNSRMSSCQVDGPGATPGSRTNSLQAARQHAAESPKLSSLRAARRQSAIFILGSWQTSNALALQASLCGSVTHRLHHPSLGTQARRGFQAKDVLHRLGEGGLSTNRVPSHGWQAMSGFTM